MDSTNPYSNSQGFVNLLNSQQDNHIPELGSSEVPLFSSQFTEAPNVGVEERKERRKWTPKEDVVLISAWLNTSKDPVVGNEQKAGAFWKRIQAYFNASPQLSGVQRKEVSHCKQRWGRLNDLVCKFVGCYEAAMKEKSSGQNENDIMKVAHEIFFNDHQIKFTLEHAWRELRHDQKWCSASAAIDGRSKKRKVDDGSAQSSSSQPISHGEDVAMARPPGVKASKAYGKRAAGVSEHALQEFQSMWEIKRKDLEMKENICKHQEKLSKYKLLDSLLAKTEPFSDIEMALKNKLITDMLT